MSVYVLVYMKYICEPAARKVFYSMKSAKEYANKIISTIDKTFQLDMEDESDYFYWDFKGEYPGNHDFHMITVDKLDINVTSQHVYVVTDENSSDPPTILAVHNTMEEAKDYVRNNVVSFHKYEIVVDEPNRVTYERSNEYAETFIVVIRRRVHH